MTTVEIDRQANNVSLTVHTARPGILIGRGGQRVDELRAKLEKMTGKRIQLNIREVPQPELDAYLVDLEDNTKVWAGFEKLKKFVGKGKYKP